MTSRVTATLALACATLTSTAFISAHAQSNVTLYGIVDSGFVYQSDPITGSGSKKSITGGGQSGSRLGLRGIEDLGSGNKAFYTLEMGINADDGTSTLGALFGRQAFVGIENTKLGSLSLGRQYTPFYSMTFLTSDTFGVGMMGAAINLQNGFTRSNNSAIYKTPTFAGLTASIMYAAGESTLSTSAGRAYSAAVLYQNGALKASLGHYSTNNATGTATSYGTMLGANYDLGPVVLFGDIQRLRSDLNGAPGVTKQDTNVNLYSLGARVPVGKHTVYGAVTYADDQRKIANANAKATHLALGYTYQLSKRTNLYSSVAKINNRNGAQYQMINATSPGYGQFGFDLGIRHLF
jgi:predicted porin